MVLFYDDDRHFKKVPPTGWRKYLRRLIKVIVIFAILLTITMWVLSTAGGNSKALRLGIQDYLTDATGYLAELNMLDSMEFFPVTHIKFSGLTLHRPLKKEKTSGQIAEEEARREQSGAVPQLKGVSDYYDPGEIVAGIGSADIRMNFWDMFFTRRRFYVLDVRNVILEENVWLPRRLHLEVLKVDDDADFPAILAQGFYGDHKLDIRVRTQKAARGVYVIPDITQFQLSIGPLQAEGTVDSGGSTSRIEFTSLHIGDHSFTGDMTMKARRQHDEIVLTLKTENSAIKADLAIGETDVRGTVAAAALDLNDVEKLHAAYEALHTLWGGERHDRVAFGKRNIDVRLVAEKLVHGAEGTSTAWGNVKADLVVQPYLWQLNNIVGLMGGGALKGAFSIDATGTGDAQLAADVNLRGWDYARLSDKDDATGQADVFLKLRSTGKTFTALAENMTGALAVLGGKGVLTPGTALYQGGEILHTLLPDLQSGDSLTMNCLLADFTLTGDSATVQSFFMDMADLTVAGEGTLNTAHRTLDLKLVPHMTATGTVHKLRPVRVQGAWAAPRITAAVGRKINQPVPAFSAWDFSALGLNKSHPCHAYIKKL